jgi:putative phage-type endonuclease
MNSWRVFCSTKGLTHEEFLITRKKGLGGSDAGAILGLSKWKSPLAVYFSKVTDEVDEKMSVAAELGHELEPFLRRKLKQWLLDNEEIDVEIKEYKHTMQHKIYDFMLCNVDGLYHDPKRDKMIGVEAKTTSAYGESEWKEGCLPDNYYAQVQHNLAVSGLDEFKVVFLIGNSKWDVLTVERNEEFIEKLIEFERKFWEENVLKEVPPVPSGLECDTNIYKELFKEEEPETIIELDDLKGTYDRYKELVKEKKEIDKEMELIKQVFMSRIGNNEAATVEGKKITWKTTKKEGHWVGPTEYRSIRIY